MMKIILRDDCIDFKPPRFKKRGLMHCQNCGNTGFQVYNLKVEVEFYVTAKCMTCQMIGVLAFGEKAEKIKKENSQPSAVSA